MTSRRVRRALATLALMFLVSLAAIAPPAARAGQRCGFAFTDVKPYGVFVARGDVRCEAARRALRTYFGSRRPCAGSSCLRRLDGWTCQTAAAFAYPRVASCQRRRALVQAIAIAD
jgi:hypothetical protein